MFENDVCNPYIQEDVEIMNKEYHFWVKERDLYKKKLGEEKRLSMVTMLNALQYNHTCINVNLKILASQAIIQPL